VRALLDYDSLTGRLTWKVSCAKAKAGKAAGWVDNHGLGQRLVIGIGNRNYLAHRLIWLWVTGDWPAVEVDHKDLDQMNNKWENLRLATPSQNKRNQRKRSDNKSGFKGVGFVKRLGKFIAAISIDKRNKHLGVFNTAEEAHAAYRKAAREHHGEFARVW
jgi:hypothetical protein